MRTIRASTILCLKKAFALKSRSYLNLPWIFDTGWERVFLVGGNRGSELPRLIYRHIIPQNARLRSRCLCVPTYVGPVCGMLMCPPPQNLGNQITTNKPIRETISVSCSVTEQSMNVFNFGFHGAPGPGQHGLDPFQTIDAYMEKDGSQRGGVGFDASNPLKSNQSYKKIPSF